MGSSRPPQSLARSPGFTSTWRECRQRWQWLRQPPRASGGTSVPQLLQVKPVLRPRTVKRFMGVIVRRARLEGGTLHGVELLRAEGLEFRAPSGTVTTASLTLRHGMRVALTGEHGSGKTLLLRLLAGLAEPLAGTVVTAPGAGAAAPEPLSRLLREPTVLAAAGRALRPLRELEQQLRSLERQLDAPGALEEYGLLTARFELAGGYTAEAELRTLLAALGFEGEQLNRPPGTLSAGELRRAQLAGILAAGAPLLLLDEPGRDLSGSMLQTVEVRLKGWRGAVLFSSHDREFIRACATHVAELRGGSLHLRRGTFRRQRRFRDGRGRSGRVLFSSGPLTLPAGDGTLLRAADLTVHRGERILLTGHTVPGPAQLLRFLADALRPGGQKTETAAVRGQPVTVLHAGRDTHGLDLRLSARENLERHVSTRRTSELLSLSGLAPADRELPARDLPEPALARTGLALLLGVEADLLLIDGAGSALDLPRLELLGETLALTEAAVIFTTPDRFLARSVANRVWSIGPDGSLADFRGGVEGWEGGRLRLEPEAAAFSPGGPAPAAAAALSVPPGVREQLEDRLLALEDLLAEAPLKKNPELTLRLERRRRQVTAQLMEVYARGLPEPAPRFRVREAGLRFEADFEDGGGNLRFSALEGARPWLKIQDGTAHLGLAEPADRCLLPAYRAALLNAAVRLTFQALPVSAVQYFDRAAPPGLRLQPAGGGWHVLSVRDFELLEGWEPREGRAA